jgi:hypothetical protein
MKLGTSIMLSEAISTVYFIDHSHQQYQHCILSDSIDFFIWLLKFSFYFLYQIFKLQWKESSQLVLPRTSCFIWEVISETGLLSPSSGERPTLLGIVDKVSHYSWMSNGLVPQRTDECRFAKIFYQNILKGGRGMRRPWKRWKGEFRFEPGSRADTWISFLINYELYQNTRNY